MDTSGKAIYEDAQRQRVLHGLTERELRLVVNAMTYADGDPAGLPGHNLLVMVAKLFEMMGITQFDVLSRIDDLGKEEKRAAVQESQP